MRLAQALHGKESNPRADNGLTDPRRTHRHGQFKLSIDSPPMNTHCAGHLKGLQQLRGGFFERMSGAHRPSTGDWQHNH